MLRAAAVSREKAKIEIENVRLADKSTGLLAGTGMSPR
jgi:hypothetical protein